ncbi:gp53-like domain-containing protein [Escherichia coli]|uniref:gp53-like domain-containing protein n=1 Tax=Escherichia coli TaxID=562 RepID=UPI003D7C1A53
MAKNDFKAFATDRNANVISQEEWEALPALLSGFTAGKASSAQVNKVIRQASFIAAALAQFVSDKTQRDVLDNGDLPGFVELLGSGFAVEYLSRKNPFGDIKSDGTVKTALENLGLGETIDKASGAMQKSANGYDISDVSAFRNALQLGTAATRDVGADNASKLLDLDSFRSMMLGNGYIYIPCIATTGNPVKLMLQWGTVATQKGVDVGYALPFAFPYAGLFATGNRGTSGYNAAMNVRIASRTHISIQNWSPSGEGTEDCCFIALGY